MQMTFQDIAHVEFLHPKDFHQFYQEEQKFYDAILIDYHMPNIGGIDALKQLREKFGSQIPVFIITQNERLSTKILCLSEAINDFLHKEMPREEIRERVLNKLRKSRDPIIIKYEQLSLDLTNLECKDAGDILSLTPKEFLTLKLVIENKGRLKKSSLLELIWPEQSVIPSTINTHLYNLNKKLKTIKLSIQSGYLELEKTNIQI